MEYDHHVRVRWFVLNHEFQHAIRAMTDGHRIEFLARPRREPQISDATYNIAMDYIINEILKASEIKV